MQAVRRVLSNAGILSGRRSMSSRTPSTAAQIAEDAKRPHGSIVDTIGVYTVTPLAVGVFIYDMFIAHEVRPGTAAAGCGHSAGHLACWLLF